MKVIPDVKIILMSKKIPARRIMKRSIAFPWRMPRSFSTRKIMLKAVLKELKTHVEVQISPPMPKIPTILRSRMILKMFLMILGSREGTAFSK
jgi:hypothetical protein